MLGRRAVLDTLCLRCQPLYGHIIALKRNAPPLFPSPRRGFRSTQNPRGLVSWLVGDNRRAKVHQEIGKMLEDYDEKLTQLYNDSLKAVSRAYIRH